MPGDKAISLLNRARSGTWKSGTLSGAHSMTNTHDLPFDGAADDSRGFVRRDLVTMEDGSEMHALRTHPKWDPDGTIKGWLPVADAPEDPVFEADVGFVEGATATDGVTFRVFAHYDAGGSRQWDQVASVGKGYDQSLDRLRADLGSYGTSLREIELRVDAGAGSAQDWAAWVDPMVLSDGDASNAVSGFLPSTAGFSFTNSFDPNVLPNRTFNIPKPFSSGTISVTIDPRYGLCGGMTFAAKDYFEAGISPWDDDLRDREPANSPVSTDQPDQGTPLFQYLWDRLIDSFNLDQTPSAVARFAKLMAPAFRDTEHPWFQGDANRSDVILDEWHRVTSEIDNGRLCPLGVVEHKTWNFGKIFFNHQVLAYGYEKEGQDATIYIYDPNCPRNDHVRLEFPLRDPGNVIRPKYRRSFLTQVDGSLEGFSVSANSADTVSGTSASGSVWQGNDGFRFSGYLSNTSLEHPGQVTVHVDGEPAPWFGTGRRSIVIEGTAAGETEYDFSVSGGTLEQVDGTLDGHSVSANPADTIRRKSRDRPVSSASGTVWQGKDGYEFTGELVSAHVEHPEDTTVYVDGTEVDQFRGAGEGTGTRTLVLEGNASNGSTYSFEVSGEPPADSPKNYAFFAIDYEPKDPPQSW